MNSDFSVLIGQNFTEHKDIMYFRVDDTLTFEHKINTPKWLDGVKHGNITETEKNKHPYSDKS